MALYHYMHQERSLVFERGFVASIALLANNGKATSKEKACFSSPASQ